MATRTDFNRGQINRNRPSNVISVIDEVMGRKDNTGKGHAVKVIQQSRPPVSVPVIPVPNRGELVARLAFLRGSKPEAYASYTLEQLQEAVKWARIDANAIADATDLIAARLGLTVEITGQTPVSEIEQLHCKLGLIEDARRIATAIAGGLMTSVSLSWPKEQLEDELSRLRTTLAQQRGQLDDARHPDRPTGRVEVVRAPRMPKETAPKPVEIVEAEQRDSKIKADRTREGRKIEIKEGEDRLGRRHRRNSVDGRFVKRDATAEALAEAMDAGDAVPSVATVRQMTRRGESVRRRSAEQSGRPSRVRLAPLKAQVRLYERTGTVTPAIWGRPSLFVEVEELVVFRHGTGYVAALRTKFDPQRIAAAVVRATPPVAEVAVAS